MHAVSKLLPMCDTVNLLQLIMLGHVAQFRNHFSPACEATFSTETSVKGLNAGQGHMRK